MPTKLNHAGNQQNYVPAGNGDASGEYCDNESGSNKHFTSFQKPESGSKSVNYTKTTKTAKSQEIRKDKYGNDMLSQKYKDIGLKAGKEYLDEQLKYYTIEKLTSTSNVFGKYLMETIDDAIWGEKDFDGYITFADYDEIIGELTGKEFDSQAYESGQSFTGFTGKGYNKKSEGDIEDKIAFTSKYQTDSDKKIQKTFNGKTEVCFGKGYSKERVEEIENATETITNDFPEIGNYINFVGDRTNLEHYINEKRENKQFSEEEISNEINRIKKYLLFSTDNNKLREMAKNRLSSKIKLTNSSNAYAYWSPDQKLLAFMGKMKKREEDDTEYLTNFKSSNKIIGTYYHELGHSIDHLLEDKINGIYNNLSKSIEQREKFNKFVQLKNEFYTKRRDLISQNVNKNFDIRKAFIDKFGYEPNEFNRDDNFKKEMLKLSLSKEGKKQFNISSYANTNSREFVAECFSAHYTDMKNDLATKTVNLYKEYLKKVMEFE